MSFPVGAIQKNKQTILDCFEIAEDKEADILIFPELALTGYPPEDLLLRESFIGKNFAVLALLLERNIIKLLEMFRVYCKDINRYRISLRFWEWMN